MTKESFHVGQLTLPSAIIDTEAKENIANLAYIAISRVFKFSDLIIEPSLTIS